MSRTTNLCLSFAVVLAASLAHAATEAKSPSVGEVKAAIEAANAKFSEAFERGDIDAVAALYSEDAMAFPPDGEMVKGRKAIGEFWKATRKSGVKSAKLTTLDVGASGDLAHETGTVLLTIQPEGKPATTVSAKYVVVWKRTGGGAWQLHRDIWN
ncbi:MAG: YybH family protein, partial [Candidatus Binatia bacterium]